MVISFDQSIADVESLVCTISNASTVTAYLTTLGSSILLVLYGFANESTVSTGTVLQQLTETTAIGLGSMTPVLLSVTRLMEIELTKFQLTISAAASIDGTGSLKTVSVASKLKGVAYTVLIVPAFQFQSMLRQIALSIVGSQESCASVSKFLKTSC